MNNYKNLFLYYLIIIQLNNYGLNIQQLYGTFLETISNGIHLNYEDTIIEKIKNDVKNLNTIEEEIFFNHNDTILTNLIPYNFLKNYSFKDENYIFFNQAIMNELFKINNDNIFGYVINQSQPQIFDIILNNQYFTFDYIQELNIYKKLYTNLTPEQRIKFNQRLENSKWNTRWYNLKKYSKVFFSISSILFIIHFTINIFPRYLEKLHNYLYFKIKKNIKFKI